MATKTLLTVEEFMRLPESVGSRDVRYELVEGELAELAPEMLQHNLTRDNVLISFLQYVDGKNLGTVIGMQACHLFGKTVRVPDVAFFRAGRVVPPNTLPTGGPDLAVEVVSPSNTPRELNQRISDYFKGGSKRVWLVYPEDQEVYVHGLAGVKRLQGDDALEDPELLPGFSVKVSSLFEQAALEGEA